MNIKLDNIFVLAFFIFTAIAVIVGFFWMAVTEKRLKRFFLGKTARNLEDTIVILEQEINNLKKAKEDAQKEIVVINAKLKKSIRGLEAIRFNPFPDQGSNQSFAIGM